MDTNKEIVMNDNVIYINTSSNVHPLPKSIRQLLGEAESRSNVVHLVEKRPRTRIDLFESLLNGKSSEFRKTYNNELSVYFSSLKKSLTNK